MIALALGLILSPFLVKEKHAQVHIGVEIDVHRQFEPLYIELSDALSQANGMVVDQNVDGALLTHDLGPQLLGALDISQISLVKVDVLESGVRGELAYIIDQLGFEVSANVNYDQIDRALLLLGQELLCQEFTKPLGTSSDQNVRTTLLGEMLFGARWTGPSQDLVADEKE